MAFTESRAGGGKVAFSRSMRRIEAVCGPSFGNLRLLGPYGLGSGWSSILRTVLGLTPVSRATCLIEAPLRKIRFRMSDHCATSRYMVGHPFARDARRFPPEVLGRAGALWLRAPPTLCGTRRSTERGQHLLTA